MLHPDGRPSSRPPWPESTSKGNQQAEVTRAELRPLLKPQTRCFQDCCPHGPAPSGTDSTYRGRQPPQLSPAPNSRRENRAAGWQFSTRDDRVRRGPGPPVPEVSFQEAKRRTAPFTAGVYRDQPALGSGRRLPANKCSSENVFQNRDAFPRTVKPIKMQKTSLGKIEPKSQLMFKIARHLVSICAPRTHWQPQPLPGTPPAQRVSCSRSAPGPARRGPEGRWSPPQRCPSHWGPHRSRPRRPWAPEKPTS